MPSSASAGGVVGGSAGAAAGAGAGVGAGVDGGGDGELDLHNTGLAVLDDASVPGTPEQRAALRKLDVSFNRLSTWTQAGVAVLQQLTGLRELHAYDNAIDSLAFINAYVCACVVRARAQLMCVRSLCACACVRAGARA